MASPMMPELETYFNKWLPKQKAYLNHLEEEARQEEIPIVGPLVGQLLYLLLRGCSSRRILELGTANGYSTLWMAYSMLEIGGRITTIENDAAMAEKARRHFKKAGVADIVNVVEGDAQTVVSGFTDLFDFIFMDIDKEFYHEMLPLCTGHIRKGGLMLVDNTGFQDADMFNHAIAENDSWAAVNFLAHLPGHSPVKDGICIALRV